MGSDERKSFGTFTADTPLSEVVALAKKGDFEAAHEVKRRYKDQPGEFVRRYSYPIDRYVVATLFKPLMKSDPLGEIAGMDRLDEMRAELAGPKASLIERLLASRIVLCWTDANIADLRLAGHDRSNVRTQEHLSRMSSRAHDRLMKALKALAYVRRVELHVLLQTTQDGHSPFGRTTTIDVTPKRAATPQLNHGGGE
jgi:hypothetical protein